MGLADEQGGELLEVIQSLRASLTANTGFSEKLTLLSARLPVIGELAAARGFLALLDVCILFKDALDQINQAETPFSKQAEAGLCIWPELLQAYIHAPQEARLKSRLIEHLCSPPWGRHVDAGAIDMLTSLLDMPVNNAVVKDDPNNNPKVGQAHEPAVETSIDEGVPTALAELLRLLIAELLHFRKALLELIAALNEGLTTTAVIIEDEKNLARQLHRYAQATETVGLTGLTQVVQQVHHNILQVVDESRLFSHEQIESLKTWCLGVLHYLRHPLAVDGMERLLKPLADPCWPENISSEQRDALLSALQAFTFDGFSSPPPPERAIATEEDVSLALEDEVSDELLDALLSELPGQIEALTEAVQRLADGGTLDDVTIAKRVAHTLKGAANTVGVRGVATLTHHLEDILLAFSKHEALPSPQISLTLMNATDALAMMGEYLLGTGGAPANAAAVLQELLDLAYRIETEGIETSAPAKVIDMHEAKRRIAQSDEQGQPQQQRRTEEEAGAVIRVPMDFVDKLLRLVGESMIMTEQIRERVRSTLSQVKNMRSQLDLLRQLGAELEEIIDVKDLSMRRHHAGEKGKFDDLEMDQYSDLHTCSRRLVEAAVDVDEMSREVSADLARLGEMLIEQADLNNETREGVMRTRMVPARAQFSRLQRSVRQAARLTGKEIALHLEGGDTLMDTDTANNMLDPLMHLLRNAVDHGIEEGAEREQRGKDGKGNIYLAFAREGNNIAVTCKDDGRGLDFAAIRETAMERGLLSEGQAVTEEELKNYILRPDFSTRSEATQVSGRGTGMDAVYAGIMDLSGSLQIDSHQGEGSLIHIQVPQTLISSHALLIRAGDKMMAIADRGIEQILHHEDGVLRAKGEEEVFEVGDKTYPVKPLEHLLSLSAAREGQEGSARTFILVSAATGKTAISVEKITGSYTLVIKSLGHYIPKLPGILGVTILGNGDITPVLDLVDLLRRRHSFGGGKWQADRVDPDQPRLPCALVVDDSLSARRALEQFMQDIGFDVRAARDGQEAVDLIRAGAPDIVLTDLEMPRMNGMELVGLLRAASETAALPVIMITSRAARKHRDEALAAGVDVYLTKPYSEDELLEHINQLRRG